MPGSADIRPMERLCCRILLWDAAKPSPRWRQSSGQAAAAAWLGTFGACTGPRFILLESWSRATAYSGDAPKVWPLASVCKQLVVQALAYFWQCAFPASSACCLRPWHSLLIQKIAPDTPSSMLRWGPGLEPVLQRCQRPCRTHTASALQRYDEFPARGQALKHGAVQCVRGVQQDLRAM